MCWGISILNITVNIIGEGARVAKRYLELPDRLVNIIRCKILDVLL